MNLPWLRLYTEFASDPKIQILAFEDQRHYVMLLCLKGSGVLDASAVNETHRERLIAKAMGLDPINAADAKSRLMDGGLISPDWQPAKWDSRQFQSDSTDRTAAARMRRMRAKRRGVTDGSDVTVTRVTVLDSDSDSDSDSDKKQRGEVRAKRSPATRLPANFELTTERAAYATAQGVDPTSTFENFTDYWTVTSGAKARKHDWDRTWHMWCRSEHRKPATQSVRRRKTADELEAEERNAQH